ncbi:MAG: hypothetical protein KIT12_13585 [Trueperaceae bacterium]|nr:hypothetical protein [Trueperaceae bacterium]
MTQEVAVATLGKPQAKSGQGRPIHSMLAALLIILLTTIFATASAREIPLVDRDGYYVAYIDTNEDSTIYLWSGEPVAYLYERGLDTLVYTFSGEHLGWYKDGILRDREGNAVGADDGVLITPTRIEPLKGFKRLKPARRVKSVAGLKPIFSNYYSRQSLEAWLRGGAASSTTSTTTAGAGAYPMTGMKWFVTRVEAGGTTVILSDGSRWEISPTDRIHTMLWLPADGVTVTLARSGFGAYNYTLLHDRDRREVLGKYLGR